MEEARDSVGLRGPAEWPQNAAQASWLCSCAAYFGVVAEFLNMHPNDPHITLEWVDLSDLGGKFLDVTTGDPTHARQGLRALYNHLRVAAAFSLDHCIADEAGDARK